MPGLRWLPAWRCAKAIMVDLIPDEYRRGVRLQRQIRGLAWMCLGVLLAMGLCAAGISHLLKEERAGLARLKHLQAQAGAQQARLTEIRARRDVAERRVRALDGLRGGASIQRLFDALDAALNGRIWFQELVYARATDAPGAADKAAEAAAARRVEAKTDDRMRRTRERADIRGLAVDHAALAEFIRELAARPGLSEVKLIDTSARNYPNVQFVDFQVSAMLAADTGAAPAAATAAPAVPLAALELSR